MNNENNIWCFYCHNWIDDCEETIQDEVGRIFHKECYEQMNNFSDDLGEHSYEEYDG